MRWLSHRQRWCSLSWVAADSARSAQRCVDRPAQVAGFGQSGHCPPCCRDPGQQKTPRCMAGFPFGAI